jgi:hypothetical protein
MDKADEHQVELIEAGEDPAESLEAPEQALDLMAFAVHGPVPFPWGKAVGFRWQDGQVAQVQRQLAGFVACLGPIHDQTPLLAQRIIRV